MAILPVAPMHICLFSMSLQLDEQWEHWWQLSAAPEHPTLCSLEPLAHSSHSERPGGPGKEAIVCLHMWLPHPQLLCTLRCGFVSLMKDRPLMIQNLLKSWINHLDSLEAGPVTLALYHRISSVPETAMYGDGVKQPPTMGMQLLHG